MNKYHVAGYPAVDALFAKSARASVSVDAGRISEIVNAVNTEDALKYLPSLFVRKRHIGDTQAPLATRTNGGGASARSLIYADGALLSALIGNNNPTASPKWGQAHADHSARNKWTLVGTYHPDEKVALTVAAKYSDQQFATIDNSDVVTHTYQGFDGFFVVDLRAKFDVTPRWSMALGIDNVNNDKYFIFHPFPQRSFSAELNFKL